MITFVFKVLPNGLLRYTYFTHVQTCDYVWVQSATELTASVPVITGGGMITFVFKVLRNGLLRYTYFTHVPTCDCVRVQSGTQWAATELTVWVGG